MPTLVELLGFEHGVGSVSGSGLFQAFTTNCSISSTTKRTGSYSLKIAPSNTQEYCCLGLSAASNKNQSIYRLYFLFHTMPSGNDLYFFRGASVDSTYIYWGIEVTTNKLFALWAGGSKVYELSGLAISQDTWYRLDIKIVWNANPHTADWQVNGIAQTQTTKAVVASISVNYIFGNIGLNSTGEFYIDDFANSVTLADYPIGAGGVICLMPSGSGTSANASGYMEDQDGIEVDDLTNPANIELDDTPPLTSMTDYIRQTTDSATHYASVLFSQTTQTIIQGVMAYLSYHCSSANANDGETRIRDGAGQETVVYNGDMSEKDVLFYKSVLVTVPAAGWSQTTVNALEGRVGYSGDAAPDPYWDALILEVAYGTVTPWVPKVIFIG